MVTYTGSDPITPIQNIFNAIQTDITGQYAVKTYKPADLNALAALTGMTAGDQAYVGEGSALFVYTTLWLQRTPANFATAAARDTAYAKAGGAYKIKGRAQAVLADSGKLTTFWNAGWIFEDGTVIPIANGTTTGVTVDPATGVVSVAGSFPSFQAFTDDWLDYEIYGRLIMGSAGGFTIRLRNAGVDDTASVYIIDQMYATGPTTLARATGTNNYWGGAAVAATNHRFHTRLEKPKVAIDTMGAHEAGSYTTAGGAISLTRSEFRHTAAASFDGFSILPGVTLASGTEFRVRGITRAS